MSADDADRFSLYLEQLLWDEDGPFTDVERVGLGALRVVLDSGTAVIVSVEDEEFDR